MLKLPEQVKVGPYRFRVERPESLVEGEQTLFGSTSFGTDVIRISTEHVKRRQVTALLHEVIHAIDDLFDLGLTEHQVSCLAPGLIMVFEDNGFLTLGGENDGPRTNGQAEAVHR